MIDELYDFYADECAFIHSVVHGLSEIELLHLRSVVDRDNKINRSKHIAGFPILLFDTRGIKVGAITIPIINNVIDALAANSFMKLRRIQEVFRILLVK